MELQHSTWAHVHDGKITAKVGPFPVQMSSSDATAQPLILLEENHFGADIISFEPGGRVALHTHKGDHILLVTQGGGTLTYGAQKHPLKTGMIYLIPGSTPHAIDADTKLTLIAIGNNHRPAHSPTRLEVVKLK